MLLNKLSCCQLSFINGKYNGLNPKNKNNYLKSPNRPLKAKEMNDLIIMKSLRLHYGSWFIHSSPLFILDGLSSDWGKALFSCLLLLWPELHSYSKLGTSHIPTSPSKATGSIYAPLVSDPPVAVFVHFYCWHLVCVLAAVEYSKLSSS